MAYNAATHTYDTFQDLRLAIGEASSSVTVLGKSGINDGFSGKFYWDDTSTATDDNLNIIRPLNLLSGRWVRLNSIQESNNVKKVIVSNSPDAKFFTITGRRNGEPTPNLNIQGLSVKIGDGSIFTVPITLNSFWLEGNQSDTFPNWFRSTNIIPFDGESISIILDATTDDYAFSVGYLDINEEFVSREYYYPQTHIFNESKKYNSLDDLFSLEPEGITEITVLSGYYKSLNPRWQMKNGWELRGQGIGCTNITVEFNYVNGVGDGLFAQANCEIRDLTLTVINNNLPTLNTAPYALHIDEVGEYRVLIERVHFKSIKKFPEYTSPLPEVCNLLGIGTHDKETIIIKDCTLEAQTLNNGNRNLGNTHNQVSGTPEVLPANLILENVSFIGGFASLLIADVNYSDESDSIRTKTKYSLLNSHIPSIKFKSQDPLNGNVQKRRNGFTFNASGSYIGEYITPQELVNVNLSNYDSTSLPITRDVDYMYVYPSPDVETQGLLLTFDQRWGPDDTTSLELGWARSTNIIPKTDIRKFTIEPTSTIPDLVISVNFLNSDNTPYYKEEWKNSNYLFSNPISATKWTINIRSESGIPLDNTNLSSIKINYITQSEYFYEFVKGEYYNPNGIPETQGGENFARLSEPVRLNSQKLKLYVNELSYSDFEFAIFYTNDIGVEYGNERYFDSNHIFSPPIGATKAQINFRRKNTLSWDETNVENVKVTFVEHIPVGTLMTYVYGERKAHWYINQEPDRNIPIGITPYIPENANFFAGVVLADAVSSKACHFKRKGLVHVNQDLSSVGIGNLLPPFKRVYVARTNANENVIDII